MMIIIKFLWKVVEHFFSDSTVDAQGVKLSSLVWNVSFVGKENCQICHLFFCTFVIIVILNHIGKVLVLIEQDCAFPYS